MRRFFKLAGSFLALLIVGVVLYGGKGILGHALADAPHLRQRADELMAQSGGSLLGAGHLTILLKVEDPNFANHAEIDFRPPVLERQRSPNLHQAPRI